MRVSLDPTIVHEIEQFKIGLIHYNKIVVEQSPQMIKGRLQLFQESLFFDLQDMSITNRPKIAEWRTIWKQFGADPNRYRNSVESLLRRIAKQNYITPLHSAVDLNNFFSLRFECPIGIYDTHAVKNDVTLHIGTKETGYDGLNGRFNLLDGILTASDDLGAFGSPFVDSIRTATSEQTTNALQIVYMEPSLSLEDSQKLLEACADMFTQVSGGHATTAILHKDQLIASL